MSYDCSNGCPRIQQFSDPTKTYNGRSAGGSSTNNAEWIRNRLSQYAKFRPTQPNVGTNVPLPVTPPPIASPTNPPVPAPTIPPTNQHMLETTLDGGFIGGAGNMFDIRAKTDLAITNFAVHSYAATTVTIEIRKKKTPGSCVGVQSNPAEWELIGTVTFGSQSATIPSVLPSDSFPRVLVKKGDVQSFYVTFQDITNYNRYSGGTALGAIFKQNDDLDILEGYAKQYNFGSDYYPRVWNGQVFYEVGTFTEAPAAPITPLTPVPATEAPVTPTAPPTPVPTTGKPVAPTIPPTLVPISLAPSKIKIQSPTSTLQSTINLTSIALQTTFAGGNGQAGNMIDITTNKAIVIKAGSDRVAIVGLDLGRAG